MNKTKRTLIRASLLVILVAIDQLSKFIVSSNMQEYQSIELIPGFFSLTYCRNTGAAWSMLTGAQGFFMIITIVALVLMILYYRHIKENDLLSKYGLILMIAGTIGNFIDRLFFQSVCDFFDFIIFGYDFPIFNIADSILCIGVAMVLIAIVIEEKKGVIN